MATECYRIAQCTMGRLRVDRNFLERVDIIGYYCFFFEKIHIYTFKVNGMLFKILDLPDKPDESIYVA